jgi:hypothetical protein
MTPAPSLQELIESVRADAAGDDALDQLAQASRTVADLEQVGDALLGHFVDQSRRAGRSWSEISAALGVSKQAAHKRFSSTATRFERFTLRARAVLGGAYAEARRLGHPAVGPEHLLLALFEPPESVAAQAFAAVGITHDAVEQQVLALAEPAPAPGDGTPGFTPEAIEVLRAAVEEALQLGHNYIGTEHLVLALVRDPDGLPALALGAVGVTPATISSAVLEQLAALTKS